MKVLNHVLGFLLPTKCLVCGEAGAVVHPLCRAQLPYLGGSRCSRCSLELDGSRRCSSAFCRLAPQQRYLNGIRAVFRHEGAARQAVIRMKYRGETSLKEWIAAELLKAIPGFNLGNFDIVAAVPMHSQRLRERGYNQAEVVAREFSGLAGWYYAGSYLQRQVSTPTQVGLNAAQRANNVQGAFQWVKGSLAEKRILLYDDVCTTGATLNECAAVLKKAGAREVWALTLTRENFKSTS